MIARVDLLRQIAQVSALDETAERKRRCFEAVVEVLQEMVRALEPDDTHHRPPELAHFEDVPVAQGSACIEFRVAPGAYGKRVQRARR
jgi:hypothetical protein